MAKPWRPTKLTPKTSDVICSAVRRGNYIETAAGLAGVTKVSIYEWIKRGDEEAERVAENPKRRTPLKDERIYLDFSNAIKKALSQSEDDLIQNMEEVADGYEVEEKTVVVKDGPRGKITETTIKTKYVRDWTAAAWRLERRHPKRWGRKAPESTEVADEQDTEGLVLIESSNPHKNK